MPEHRRLEVPTQHETTAWLDCEPVLSRRGPEGWVNEARAE